MKTNGNSNSSRRKLPAFASRAERALRRAARTVRARSHALKVPVVVWEGGKVVEKIA